MMHTAQNIQNNPATAEQEQAANVAGIAPAQAIALEGNRLTEIQSRDAEQRAQAALRQSQEEPHLQNGPIPVGNLTGLSTAERQVQNMAVAALNDGATPETIAKSADLIRHSARAAYTPGTVNEEPEQGGIAAAKPTGSPSKDEKLMAPKAGATPATKTDDLEIMEPGLVRNGNKNPVETNGQKNSLAASVTPPALAPDLARSIENEIALISGQFRQEPPAVSNSLTA